jgi:hypothetical protein
MLHRTIHNVSEQGVRVMAFFELTPSGKGFAYGLDTEKAEKALRAPIGAASPLWLAFAGAASAGVAFWWMSRWMRPVNLEAFLFTAPAAEPIAEPVAEAVAELAAPAPEPVEIIAEAVSVEIEPTLFEIEPTPEAAPEPVLEAAPEPVVEPAPEPAPVAKAAPTEPEPVKAKPAPTAAAVKSAGASKTTSTRTSPKKPN